MRTASFDCYGDEIIYDGRTIAILASNLPASFVEEVRSELQGFETELERDSRNQQAIDAACEEAKEAGIEEGKNDAQNEFEDKLEKAEADAFEAGRAQALKDLNASKDVARISALLQAMRDVHNTIQPLWQGYEEPGKYKKRNAKIGETKRAAQSACAAIHRAINAFED